MQPFQIYVSEEQLSDLRERLQNTRWPHAIEVSNWSYGTDARYLAGLTEYWQTAFDWRKQERRLNALPQFRADVSGLNIHFIHVVSQRSDAIPLLLCHGWPGGINEFEKVIQPLSNPQSASLPAFHLVIPSMPGYGFSDAPRTAGVANVGYIADLWGELMQSLGYDRFAVQGGDWGAWVAIAITRRMPERIIGAHLNYVPARFLPAPEPQTATPEEREYLAHRRIWTEEESAYAQIQGTKPQTLGFALGDSPVGLAAWIVEKFYGWSGCKGDIESAFTKDELLTNISLYWFTNSILTAMTIYKESRLEMSQTPWQPHVSPVPIAVAQFPYEIPFPPRSHVAKYLNIVRWTHMQSGGHFAALESPHELTEDIQSFFTSLKAQS